MHPASAFFDSLNKRRYFLRILPLPVCILHPRRYVDDIGMDEGNRLSCIGCREAAREKPWLLPFLFSKHFPVEGLPAAGFCRIKRYAQMRGLSASSPAPPLYARMMGMAVSISTSSRSTPCTCRKSKPALSMTFACATVGDTTTATFWMRGSAARIMAFAVSREIFRLLFSKKSTIPCTKHQGRK